MSVAEQSPGCVVSLPYPPSANALWRAVKGRNIKSAEYRKWLSAALAQCFGAKKVPGKYHMRLIAVRPDNRRRDLSNLMKAVEDALQAAGVIEDDSLAQSIHLEWVIGAPVKGGAITVTVEPC